MKMVFRWFGPESDPIPLKYIAQIPGITGVVSSLYGLNPGESWQYSDVENLKSEVEQAGLLLLGIESINVSDAIKAGTPERDSHIENYIASLEAVGKTGIRTVCYNFMPVFDWTRSDLARLRSDGSEVFAYNQAEIDKIDPENIYSRMESGSQGHSLPGWEPERMESISTLFSLYKNLDADVLMDNLVYFLSAIEDVCSAYGIVMALHPDDPPWPVFSLPRTAGKASQFRTLFRRLPSAHNGMTFCSGSLGADPKNNLVEIIQEFGERIAFAHLRNVRHNAPGDFEECAHFSPDGSLDMYEICKALVAAGFDGIIRPDHGRDIWGEKGFPGYGLNDRALGLSYLNGLFEAITKSAMGT